MTTCPCLRYTAATPGINHLGLGVAALRYQQAGYAVLPLVRGGKKPHRMLPWDPATPSGVHLASLDPRAPAWAWGQDPAANVGVATGSVSRLAVIDLDVKRGQDGPGEWGRFLAQYRLAMPASPAWVATPSGGLHIWLRTPAGVRVPERPAVLPGVDVKGDGGLVVAPPSMQLQAPLARPGERGGDPVPVPYAWSAGCPCQVPDAPEWLLPWLDVAPGGTAAGPHEARDAEPPDPGTLARNGIPRGQRNVTLYRLACSRYRVHGTGPDGAAAVLAELEAVMAASDHSDFTRSELLRITDSARRFVAGRQDLERKMIERWQATLAR